MTYRVERLVLNLVVNPNCTYALKNPKLNEAKYTWSKMFNKSTKSHKRMQNQNVDNSFSLLLTKVTQPCIQNHIGKKMFTYQFYMDLFACLNKISPHNEISPHIKIALKKNLFLKTKSRSPSVEFLHSWIK